MSGCVGNKVCNTFLTDCLHLCAGVDLMKTSSSEYILDVLLSGCFEWTSKRKPRNHKIEKNSKIILVFLRVQEFKFLNIMISQHRSNRSHLKLAKLSKLTSITIHMLLFGGEMGYGCVIFRRFVLLWTNEDVIILRRGESQWSSRTMAMKKLFFDRRNETRCTMMN